MTEASESESRSVDAPTLVVVNGEHDWQDYLPSCRVVRRRLQEASWALRDGKLWVIDSTGGVCADAVLWRVGAIRPRPAHRSALEIIRLAQIPCVNAPNVLLANFDRLAMLHHARSLGLPVIAFDVVIGERMLARLAPTFPVVVKVGSYHGGNGKIRVENQAQWLDVIDLLDVSEEFVTVEPYIDYRRDIRCLAIGEQVWAMQRQGRSWKANQHTVAYVLVEPPPILAEHARTAMRHFHADIFGLDFLETHEGEYILLEINDVPGLTGWPPEIRHALAARLMRQLPASTA